jgi:hypothetical protein
MGLGRLLHCWPPWRVAAMFEGNQKMLPGQEPYTEAELAQLYGMVRDAAVGDPGEEDEREAPQ